MRLDKNNRNSSAPRRAALETCAEMNVSAVKHLEITLSFSLNVWKKCNPQNITSSSIDAKHFIIVIMNTR